MIVLDTTGAFLSLETVAADAWATAVDVVPWTPGSSLGIPIAIDILSVEGMTDAQVGELAFALTALIGWSPTVRDGKSVHALIDAALNACRQRGLRPRDFHDLAEFISSPPRPFGAAFRRLCARELAKGVRERLAALDDGASRLLFSHGSPLSIEALIDIKRPNRPRISIIALEALPDAKERELFIVRLLHLLENWPAGASALAPVLCIADARCALPARKSAVRETARRHLRQARAAGRPVILATDDLEDLDLKPCLSARVLAIAEGARKTIAGQTGTPPRATSLKPTEAGRFAVLVGDEVFVDVKPRRPKSSSRRVAAGDIPALVSSDERRHFEAEGRDSARRVGQKTIAEQIEGAAASPERAEALLGLTAPPRNDYEVARQERLESALAFLRESRELVTADALAEAVGATRAGAMRLLRELTEVGLVNRVRSGRIAHYYAAELTHHPRLGILETIERAPMHISREQAIEAAEREVDTFLFFVRQESVATESVRCLHYPLWRCNFIGFRREGILRRLTTASANVYLHPSAPQLCVMSRSKGFRFVIPDWQRNPVEIRDVDDISDFESGSARGVELARWALDDLCDRAEVAHRFQDTFHIDAEVSVVFLPIWAVTLESKSGEERRVIYIDALLGKPIEI